MSAEEKPEAISAELVFDVRRRTGMPVLECKRYLEQLPPADYAKFMVAIATQHGQILHDPIEDDPAYASILDEVAREAEYLIDQQIQKRQRELRANGLEHMESMARRGVCHGIWHIMQRLLRERHGVEWRTPAQMNPGVCFD